VAVIITMIAEGREVALPLAIAIVPILITFGALLLVLVLGAPVLRVLHLAVAVGPVTAEVKAIIEAAAGVVVEDSHLGGRSSSWFSL
jgi:hypothetical protein